MASLLDADEATEEAFRAASSTLRQALRQRTIAGAAATAELVEPSLEDTASGSVADRNGRPMVPLLDMARVRAVAATGPLSKGSFGGIGQPMPQSAGLSRRAPTLIGASAPSLSSRGPARGAAISAWAAKKGDPPLVPKRPKTLSEKSRSDAPSALSARSVLAYGSGIPDAKLSKSSGGLQSLRFESGADEGKKIDEDGPGSADSTGLSQGRAAFGLPRSLLERRLQMTARSAAVSSSGSERRHPDPRTTYGAYGKSEAVVAAEIAEAEAAAGSSAVADGSMTQGGGSRSASSARDSSRTRDKLTGRVAAAAEAQDAAMDADANAPALADGSGVAERAGRNRRVVMRGTASGTNSSVRPRRPAGQGAAASGAGHSEGVVSAGGPGTAALDLAVRGANAAWSSREALEHELRDFRPFMRMLSDRPDFDVSHIKGGSFVYLRAPRGLRYELEVCPPAEVEHGNAITLSARGITWTVDNKPSQFMTVDEFERERFLYWMTRRLPFFFKYRRWRVFSAWHKLARAGIITRRRSRLARSLFACNSHLRSCTYRLREGCEELVTTALFQINFRQVYTLAKFCAAQDAQRRLVADEIETFVDRVRADVLDTLRASVKSFLEAEGFAAGDGAAAAEETVAALGLAGQATSLGSSSAAAAASAYGTDLDGLGASASLARSRLRSRSRAVGRVRTAESSSRAARTDGGISFTERASIRRHCRRLARFVRVCDFIIADTLMRLAMTSTRWLMECLDHAIYTSRAMAAAHEQAAGVVDEAALAPFKTPLFTVDLVMDDPTPESAAEACMQQEHLLEVVLHTKSDDGDAGTAGAGRGAKRAAWQQQRGGAGAALASGGGSAGAGTGEGAFDGASASGSTPGRSTLWSTPGRRGVPLPTPMLVVEEDEVMLHFALGHTDGIAFSPSVDQFQTRIEAVIYQGVHAVSSASPLLSHADFAPFLASTLDDVQARGDGLGVEALLRETDEFVRLADTIVSRVKDSFDAAFAESTKAQPFRQLALMDVHDASAISVAAVDATPSSTLQSSVKLRTHHLTRFELVPAETDVGTVRVDAKGLRRSLPVYTNAYLGELFRVMPVSARRLNERLVSELTSSHNSLSSQPEEVEDFVNLMEALSLAQERMSGWRESRERVDDMMALITAHRSAVREEDNSAVRMMRNKLHKLEKLVQAVEESAEARKSHFSEELAHGLPQLRSDIAKQSEHADSASVHEPSSDPEDVVALLKDVRAEVAELERQRNRFLRFQTTLKAEQPTGLETLDAVKESVEAKLALWEGVLHWKEATDDWMAQPLASVDTEHMSQQVTAFARLALRADRTPSLHGSPVIALLRSLVNEVRVLVPVLSDLLCPAFTRQHQLRVHALIDVEALFRPKEVRVRTLVEHRVVDHASELARLASEAVQERVLSSMLEKVQKQWKDAELIALPFRDTRDSSLLGGIDAIFELLDESFVTLNAVLGSRFVGRMRERVNAEQEKLLLVRASLDAWTNLQRKWMYLWPIFRLGGDSIKTALRSEHKAFGIVDTAYKEIMKRVRDDSNAMRSCMRPKLQETLEKHTLTLDEVLRRLEAYLETKRLAFPRFYFLADEDLLDCIANAADPHRVQPHLRKMFDNVYQLGLEHTGAGTVDITYVVSAEGETMNIGTGRGVRVSGEVEDWLRQVELQCHSSLRQAIRSGLSVYGTMPREDFAASLDHLGQAVGTVCQIMWAAGTEAAIRAMPELAAPLRASQQDSQLQAAATSGTSVGIAMTGSDRTGGGGTTPRAVASNAGTGVGGAPVPETPLREWLRVQVSQLEALTHKVRQPMAHLQRTVLTTLITTDVHARTIVERLANNHVATVSDFAWEQQLRFYWRRGASASAIDTVEACQADTTIMYQYEYQGCTSRLVITPLTDRCWMTITGALRMRLSAQPSGPAGTGKTESSKDLCKNLAIQCIVFNCSEQITQGMMARLFSGLAQSGAWTCLDEFNRIDVEVLSVVAQQLLELRNARLAGADTVNFQGHEIILKDHHVIVTMNPGYAGRSELPDNLKALFRPVAMMVPDYGLIAEVMLFSQGFTQARPLSRKMVRLYKLCSEQLSQQRHYDFGMRAVKSVLVMAGALRRASPDLDEAVVLIRAMRDSNVPKFLADDLPLFHAIVQDLFPGMVIREQDDADLVKEVTAAMTRRGLQPLPSAVRKSVQLAETLDVRFGAVLVGPAGGGKTTARQVLAEASSIKAAKQFAAARSVPFDSVDPRRPGSLTYRSSEGWGLGDSIGGHADPSEAASGGGEAGAPASKTGAARRGRQRRKGAKAAGGLAGAGGKAGAPSTVRVYELNPKAISLGELYGEFNDLTLEWTDGLAASMMRAVVRTPGPDKHWVTFDGPVDAVWIENMNTVLDDNKMLCLANGERIKLKDTMRVLFEVGDLAKASPATVSRLGVVYMAPDSLGWAPLLDSWLVSEFALALIPAAVRRRISEAASNLLPALFSWMGKEGLGLGKQTMPVPAQAMTQTLIQLMEGMYGQTLRTGLEADADIPQAQKLADRFLVFAAVWATAGTLHDTQWPVFDKVFREHTRKAGLDVGVPQTGLTLDYYVRVDETAPSGMFRPWKDIVPAFEWPAGAPFARMIVPTVDTLRFSGVARLLMFGPKALPFIARQRPPLGFVLASARGLHAGKGGGSSASSGRATPAPIGRAVSRSASRRSRRGGANSPRDADEDDEEAELTSLAAALWDYAAPETGWIKCKSRPVFFTGVSGAGKTVILASLLREAGAEADEDLTAVSPQSIQLSPDPEGGAAGAAAPAGEGAGGFADSAGGGGQSSGVSSSSGMPVPTARAVALARAAAGMSGPSPGKGMSPADAPHIFPLDDVKAFPVPLMFSATTTSQQAQQSIESQLVRRKRGLYSPPAGRRAVVFVDDVNMPTPEEYGAQPPIELLRQLMDRGGLYGRTKQHWWVFDDTTVACAAGPPGGGRYDLSGRFTRHFATLAVPSANDATLRTMYTSLLQAHLAPFASDVRSIAGTVVAATVGVYLKCQTDLLPTPAKTHYVFTLRDVSRVFQGLCMIKPDNVRDVPTMVRLWVHETMRVFHDRLVTDADRQWLQLQVVGAVNRHFRLPWSLDALFGRASEEILAGMHEDEESEGDQGGASVSSRRAAQATTGPIVWGDFFTPPGDDMAERVYEECPSPKRLKAMLEAIQEEHDVEAKRPLRLVLFAGVIHHVLRLCRILAHPRGHAILVGVGGSGRQSVARFAAHISACELYKPPAGSGFTRERFREDVKSLIRNAGVDGLRSMLLLGDSQLSNDGVLEDVNALLNSGSIPGLFLAEEEDAIVTAMGDLAEAGLLPGIGRGAEQDEDTGALAFDSASAAGTSPRAASAAAGGLASGTSAFSAAAGGTGLGAAGGVEDEDALLMDPSSGRSETAGHASRSELMAAFVERVRERLHVVLAMSPVGASLRSRLRRFPSLQSCCTVDWYGAWPRSALESVASSVLVKVCLPSTIPERPMTDDVRAGGWGAHVEPLSRIDPSNLRTNERTRAAVVGCCVHIHASALAAAAAFREQTGRRVYITPTSFLDMLSLTRSRMGRAVSLHRAALRRLAMGVHQLGTTETKVSRLRVELTEMRPILETKAKETAELLVSVRKETEVAAQIEETVAEEEAAVRAKAVEVEKVRAEAKESLSVAMPRLEGAIDALKSISKGDISEISSFSKPPPGVRIVMEAVCLLLSEPTSWDAAKRILSKPDFLKSLHNFPRDSIPPSVLRKLGKYTSDEAMSDEAVKRASNATMSLATWVRAIENYSNVASDVRPLQERVSELSRQLESANLALEAKQRDLQAIRDEVARLQKTCDDEAVTKIRLERDIARAAEQLQRAQQIIDGVSSEGVRWGAEVDSMRTRQDAIVGDVLLACGTLAYLGPFDGAWRRKLLREWAQCIDANGLQRSMTFTLEGALSSPSQVRQWELQGLPVDDVSVQNAIFATASQTLGPVPVGVDGAAAAGTEISFAHDADEEARALAAAYQFAAMRSTRKPKGGGSTSPSTSAGSGLGAWDEQVADAAPVDPGLCRWPLIVDPQLQAARWVRAREGSRLCTVSMVGAASGHAQERPSSPSAAGGGSGAGAGASGVAGAMPSTSAGIPGSSGYGRGHPGSMLGAGGDAMDGMAGAAASGQPGGEAADVSELPRVLEGCLRQGLPLLLEDVGETMPSILEPILARNFARQNSRLMVSLGNSDIDVAPGFRLYMTTTAPNPHILPEVAIRVTLVNFTVTRSGLEDQLLSMVVASERPAVEEARTRLAVETAKQAQQLVEAEDMVLSRIVNAGDSILEDSSLVSTLQRAQAKAADTHARLSETARVRGELAHARNKYRGVAERGALLYFAIADLSKADAMYQYSLPFFTNLFQGVLADPSVPFKGGSTTMSTDRVEAVVNALTSAVYRSVCRGLFDRDKTLFAFLVCVRQLQTNSVATADSISLLLRGAGVGDREGWPCVPGTKDATAEIEARKRLQFAAAPPNADAGAAEPTATPAPAGSVPATTPSPGPQDGPVADRRARHLSVEVRSEAAAAAAPATGRGLLSLRGRSSSTGLSRGESLREQSPSIYARLAKRKGRARGPRLSQAAWDTVVELSRREPDLSGLVEHMQEHWHEWQWWAGRGDPFLTPLPPPWSSMEVPVTDPTRVSAPTGGGDITAAPHGSVAPGPAPHAATTTGAAASAAAAASARGEGFGDRPSEPISIGPVDGFAEPAPSGPRPVLTSVHKAVLVRSLATDRFLKAATCLIREVLGDEFASPPASSAEDALTDMSADTPCVVVLSQGADPTDQISSLARRHKQTLYIVSMGKGQGTRAEEVMATAKRKGHWVLLHNCHLAASWLPELERILAAQRRRGRAIHKRFRLWLTSLPVDYFPSSILQSSVKLTNEPPHGLAANLTRCLATLLTPQRLEALTLVEPEVVVPKKHRKKKNKKSTKSMPRSASRLSGSGRDSEASTDTFEHDAPGGGHDDGETGHRATDVTQLHGDDPDADFGDDEDGDEDGDDEAEEEEGEAQELFIMPPHDVSAPEAVWKRVAFGMCCFHAIVLERRRFGPLGWNIRYEFADSDLTAGLDVVAGMVRGAVEGSLVAHTKGSVPGPKSGGNWPPYSRPMAELEEDAARTGRQSRSGGSLPVPELAAPLVQSLPWDAMRFVVGNITYGGRVTDEWDRRCLVTILDNLMQPSIADPRNASVPDFSLAGGSGGLLGPGDGASSLAGSPASQGAGAARGPALTPTGSLTVPLATGDNDHQRFLGALKASAVSLHDTPHDFGMHENAAAASRAADASRLLATCVAVGVAPPLAAIRSSPRRGRGTVAGHGASTPGKPVPAGAAIATALSPSTAAMTRAAGAAFGGGEDTPQARGHNPTAGAAVLRRMGAGGSAGTKAAAGMVTSIDGLASSDPVFGTITMLLEQIPELLSETEARKHLFKAGTNGLPRSLTVILRQEMHKFNRLLLTVTASLRSLQRCIVGLEVMSSSLERVYDAVQANCVPAAWTDVGYPSLKPLGGWARDLRRRVAFFRRWLRRGRPSMFLLSAFFFPQGFLTAVLQRHARKYGLPISSLEFAFRFVKDDSADDDFDADAWENGQEPESTLGDAGKATAKKASPGAADRANISLKEADDEDVPEDSSNDGSSSDEDEEDEDEEDEDGEGSDAEDNTAAIAEDAEDGVLVFGLFLDGGASWDAGKALLRVANRGELHCSMPPLRVIPVVSDLDALLLDGFQPQPGHGGGFTAGTGGLVKAGGIHAGASPSWQRMGNAGRNESAGKPGSSGRSALTPTGVPDAISAARTGAGFGRLGSGGRSPFRSTGSSQAQRTAAALAVVRLGSAGSSPLARNRSNQGSAIGQEQSAPPLRLRGQSGHGNAGSRSLAASSKLAPGFFGPDGAGAMEEAIIPGTAPPPAAADEVTTNAPRHAPPDSHTMPPLDERASAADEGRSLPGLVPADSASMPATPTLTSALGGPDRPVSPASSAVSQQDTVGSQGGRATSSRMGKRRPDGLWEMETPVYKTATRAGMLSTTGISTNFVLSVHLPSQLPPRAWVLKGAALLLSLPE